MIQTQSNHCCHTYMSLHCVVDSTQCFDVYMHVCEFSNGKEFEWCGFDDTQNSSDIVVP